VVATWEREAADVDCFEFRSTVVVEVHRLNCAECGPKVENIEQVPSKSALYHTRRFEDQVGEACESAAARRVARLKQLGVDEIYMGEKIRFITAVSNLETGEPLWFGRERKRETLDEFFRTQLRSSQRRNIAAAPFSQINWWMPVYEIEPRNGMAFHPLYWDRAVPNSSDTYNYYQWNLRNRRNASQHVKSDTRTQPRPQVSLDPDTQLRLVANVGSIMLFSGAQLHSTVQNTTGLVRYSIDFRTVHVDDVWNRRGAPNLDSACTGTTMRDYIRATDLTPIPEEAVALYLDGTETEFCHSASSA
jgi:hypothetical protein